MIPRAVTRRGLPLSLSSFLLALFASGAAFADQVAVLPFTPAPTASNLAKPELEQARKWTRDAVVLRGHTLPSDAAMLSGEMAVKDGVADTSQEYRAAGRASGSPWTLTGHVSRIDVPIQTDAAGKEEGGYTLYRVELEACQVETGRVESLAREIDADEAPAEIGEMLGLLVRPEGLSNAEIPWQNGVRRKPKPRPKPEPAPLPPPPKPEPPPPAREPAGPPPQAHPYAEGHPLALGVSVGVSAALARPEQARGSTLALPVGGTLAYAIASLPGLELRGIFTGQVAGPRAIEIAGGARYAFAVAPAHRIYVGPELLLGAHVTLGGEKTGRFSTHGALFVAWGVTERVQLELAGDLQGAFGGSASLVLGGGTARALVRF